MDTAPDALVRRGLRPGRLPAPGAVRVEEMVNSFPYDLAEPAPGGPPLQPPLGVTATPWNPDPFGWRAEAVELMALSAEAAALAARRSGTAPGG